MHFLERRPYTETTDTKTDHSFQATLGLNGKNRCVALKQHWETQEVKVIKSLEGSGVLIDGVNAIVKHEIKKQLEGGFIGALIVPLPALMVQPVISSVVKRINGGGVRVAGREYVNGNFHFHSIL